MKLLNNLRFMKVVLAPLTGSPGLSADQCVQDWTGSCCHVWDQVDPALPLQPQLGAEGGAGGGEGGFPLAGPPRRKHQGAQRRPYRGSSQVGESVFNI